MMAVTCGRFGGGEKDIDMAGMPVMLNPVAEEIHLKKHCLNLRKRQRLLISLLLLATGLAPVLVGQITADTEPVDGSGYICLKDIGDFEAIFLEHQLDFLRIVPPSVDFILVQPYRAPLFFDSEGFSKTFSDNLIGEFTPAGIPEYEVRVYEDPTTREIKFLNDANQLLEALAAPVDYNPYSHVASFYPALYTSFYSDTERDWLKALYDPSRVQGVFRLIPLGYAVKYEEAKKKQRLLSKPGRIKDETIVRRSSGSSNELWLAISNKFDGGSVEISINVPTSIQTNHLEIYTTEDLLTFWWDIAASNLVAGLGTNMITWTHDASAISNKTVLYYTTGNVDVDSDGDDLADTHERFLHHTDPGDPDTDDDLLGDGEEVNSYFTDPLQEDTDGDYSPDGYEVAHSTDPLSAASYSTLSVSGRVFFMDFQQTVRVFAAVSSNDWESPYGTNILVDFFMADFEITNVPGGGKYWLRAYHDADSSGSADACDSHGEYTNIWISITNDLTEIEIHLGTDQTAPLLQIPTNISIACGESLDPTNTGQAVATDDWSGVLLLTYTDTVTVVYSNFDRIVTRKWTAEDYCTNGVTATQTIHQALCDLDTDGLPDEWEQQIVDFDLMDGITNFYDVVSTNDFDDDGLTNGEEFELGTDPTALDTDLDWAGDAYEVAEETDPTDYSSTPALRMVINDNDLYASSTWLSLSFPGLVADTLNISESWNMSNSTPAVKSEPTTFILPSGSNGLRTVYVKLVRASDGQLSSRLMSSIRLDTEPPAVDVVSPTNDWRTSRRWILFEGTATDTVSGVRVLINDEYADGMEDCEFQHNRLHLEKGTNLIAVVGTDAAGNAATQTVSVIQDFSDDTNAPIFTMNLPLDYEVSGGVTNWLDTTTYGSNEVLFLNGGIDDETAEIQFLVIADEGTNGPFAGRAAGTQLWGRVDLFPGTNSLIVLADDAAGNVATGIYTIVRNTGMVFEITYPVAYQTLNASAVTVHGVASPFFSNAVITVNGIACSITDNGSNVTFATVEPVPLNAGRNSISGVAEVNGRVYYTDPEHFGYEILKYRAQYDDFWDDDWDGDPPVMLRYLYTWDNQTQLYIDERYEDGVLARHTNYFKPTLDWENGDAYCDFGEGTWDHYNLSKSALRHIDYNYKSWLHFTKHWPTQEVQMVIFQFIDLEYERAPGVEIDPSLITYRGQTGFWYNGHVSFVVPIKTDTEYVIKQEDFMIEKEYGWPGHDYEIGPYTNAGFSTVYLEHSYGHWLWFRYFTNDVLSVDSVDVHASDSETHKIPAVSGAAHDDHFVCVKDTGDIVLNATISPNDPAVLDQLVWEADGATITYPAVGTDKRTAKLSSATSQKIPVRIKVGGSTCWEGATWVVWSSGQKVADRPIQVGTTTIQTGDGTTGPGILIDGGYDFKFTITPASLITDSDRPDLSGANSYSGSTVDPPGAGTLHFIFATDIKGGAAAKWDVSRRIKAKVLNPHLYDQNKLDVVPGTLWNNQPVATDLPVAFPGDDRAGNDDTSTGDESNNPYSASSSPHNTHAIGEISSTDAPNHLLRHSTGSDGDTFELRYHFGEFARVLLADQWYRCSDFFDWRAHFKIKRQAGQWVNDGSSVALDNSGF